MQNPQQVDSWFYWGAGDNPRLSYSNNFGDTYYLERYVLIVPQLFGQLLFGPFLGSLAVAIFWLSISYFLLWKFAQLFGVTEVFLAAVPFFLLSRGNLINFGSNLHHPATITLLLLLAYLMLSQHTFKILNMNFSNLFLIGVVWGVIANAYLIIAVYSSVAIILFLVRTTRKLAIVSREFPLTPRFFSTTFSKLLAKVFFGFLSTSAFFEIIHLIITDASRPLLWSQISIGSSFLQNQNPWNGAGFLDFWTRGLFTFASLPWLTLILASLVSLFIYNDKSSFFTDSRLLVSGIIIAMSLTTFGYSAPTFHTFTACVFVPLFFIVLLLALKRTLEFHEAQVTRIFLIFTCFCFSILQVLWIQSFKFSVQSFAKLNLVLILVYTLLGAFSLFIKLKKFNFSLILGRFLCLFTVAAALTPQSLLQLYTAENIVFDSYNNGRYFYEGVSKKRELIFREIMGSNTTTRIWVTPDDDNALASSLLYGYSLISFQKKEPSCGQVEWALQQQKSLLVSFNPINFSSDSLERYLIPCGAGIDNFRFSNGIIIDRNHPYVFGEIVRTSK